MMQNIYSYLTDRSLLHRFQQLENIPKNTILVTAYVVHYIIIVYVIVYSFYTLPNASELSFPCDAGLNAIRKFLGSSLLNFLPELFRFQQCCRRVPDLGNYKRAPNFCYITLVKTQFTGTQTKESLLWLRRNRMRNFFLENLRFHDTQHCPSHKSDQSKSIFNYTSTYLNYTVFS